MYYNLFDSHTHSENSPDGFHSISFMAETAIDRGLLGLAVTDHCECENFDEDSYERRIRQSALDTAMSREAFGKRLILTLGIEIAQIAHNPAAADRIMALCPYDFVIGSLHRLVYENFSFYSADYSEMPRAKFNEYMLKYYEEMLDFIDWGNFDVLGHLSYPVRYPKQNYGIDTDFTLYREPVDAVLRKLVDCGKGLELNTSSLRGPLEDAMPPLWVLKRYRELGGEIVTIGSDAHSVEDIGAGIEHGMRMLQDAGFAFFAFYRQRRPVLLRII